ncbi:MAG: glycoside hydrolase family 18 protein [Saprospiraceae bacterium]|nr:glycoside hydrolase family 18 protein [Saprospiraceae bacterium]
MTQFQFLNLILLALILSCKSQDHIPATPDTSQQKVIVGYVPGFRGVLNTENISANKLTHINYAFVNVKDSMAWLTNLATDSINFRKLNALKNENPELKILISIGGWSWSENFSDAVLTSSSRKKFANTSVQIVKEYGLDGVDIDWEYPGLRGEDNVFRDVDKQNFTLMFKEIRSALDDLSKETGRSYQLTSAVAGFKAFLDHTEMGAAAAYQDFINIMCYDYYTGGPMAGHHSNLFPPSDFEQDRSAEKDIRMFLDAGVPANKIVLGVPFYGRSWIMTTTENRGINMPRDSVLRGGGYSYIKDSMIGRPGFIRHWDENANSPYLFNEETRQLVVYDDEESIRIKCNYILENDLRGIMFWQYMSDPKEYLLTEINNVFTKRD